MTDLEHAYDPQKRREYYLRTRQLKGRRKGQLPQQVARSKAGRAGAKGKTRRTELEARVEALNARLDRLREVLRELVKQAKTRSGVDVSDDSSKKSSSSSSTSKSSGGSDKKTASEKRKDAERAKEYREKNKKPSLSKEAKEIEAKIKETRKKIQEMRKEIAEAKKKANKKAASSVGARSTNN